MKFDIIVAATKNNGIGYKGTLPWHIPQDLMHFYTRTTATSYPGQENVIIMGYGTWRSLPKRPLPHRRNIVLTSRLFSSEEKIETASSFEEALHLASQSPSEEKNHPLPRIFVIGGGEVFAQALVHPWCRKVYLTSIGNDIVCDRFLPPDWNKNFNLIYTSPPHVYEQYSYNFLVYRHRRLPSTNTTLSNFHPEEEYLRVIDRILISGTDRVDRTGVGTRSLFGLSLRFDLSQGFPLLTTKRVFWKGVVQELLFFLRADTDAKILDAQGVKIWNAHGSESYLRSRGIMREEGDLGPIYGYQWRHWGAQYGTCHSPKTGGIDQIHQVIESIKSDPNSRRHLVSAWNVSDLPQMALPPCHVLFQFYVNNSTLSCQVYQRSADVGLGLPFNIASYSLLTHVIAQVTNLQVGEVILVLGDAHIYHSHIGSLREQLTRTPYTWPTLRLNPKIKDIDSFQVGDITLEGYQAHTALSMPMAV